MASSDSVTGQQNSAGAPTVNQIRNISQTVQEREIVKTAPDLVVFIDGLPYLFNPFINDPRTGKETTYVNFNDHIVSFSATYDTDAMVPSCTIGLQVPNFQKHLYIMPGGNNLLQTMAQIQVYAKGYYLAHGTGDTVYRRVFKGVTSYISYNDNGKTLEVSIQCHGIMHLLEKMQTNIHPSAMTTQHTGTSQTIWQSKYGGGDCYQILAQVFVDALRSDGFQFGSVLQASMRAGSKSNSKFFDAVNRGFMAKWQAILTNMVKDVHIFGPYKDILGDKVHMKKNPLWGGAGKDTQSSAVSKVTPQAEKDLVAEYSTYYGNIKKYYPFRSITSLDLKNSVIVNRLDIIREVVGKMDYEAYQDIDGKIIIKPPLYNLDVVNIGVRTSQTQTNPNSSHNSFTNPETQIYEQNNPFVIYLSEILTEQESEDQSAIRRTRTTIVGNVLRNLDVGYDIFHSPVAEYIDISKLAKFGLREEPLYQVPWISLSDRVTLFAHAAAETARANRGYRTYTFTIPMRPELKLGFPVYIPHKDMYAYVKSVSLNFSIGGTATMTVTCDSVRRRVLINTEQKSGSGNSKTSFFAYTPAPNLVYQWTKVNPVATIADITHPNPNQSISAAQAAQQQAELLSTGPVQGVSESNTDFSNPVDVSQTLPNAIKNLDGTSLQPTQEQLKVFSARSQNLNSIMGNQFDTPFATYVVKNDNDKDQGTVDPVTKMGFFDHQRPADLNYIQALTGNSKTHTHSVMPFTDNKGYEVVAPFPWGRYIDLNTAIKEFTEVGWIQQPTDINGNLVEDLQDLQILQNTDAFLFAGLGTPTASGDPSTQVIHANQLNAQARRVGGSLTGQYAQQPIPNPAVPKQSAAQTATPAQTSTTNTTNTTTTTTDPNAGGFQKSDSEPDATVIVLHYDPSQPGAFGTNALLNASQPENEFAKKLLLNTQNTAQQTVDVLVSGSIAPPRAVQEALLTTLTQLPNGNIVKIQNKPKG